MLSNLVISLLIVYEIIHIHMSELISVKVINTLCNLQMKSIPLSSNLLKDKRLAIELISSLTERMNTSENTELFRFFLIKYRTIILRLPRNDIPAKIKFVFIREVVSNLVSSDIL